MPISDFNTVKYAIEIQQGKGGDWKEVLEMPDMKGHYQHHNILEWVQFVLNSNSLIGSREYPHLFAEWDMRIIRKTVTYDQFSMEDLLEAMSPACIVDAQAVEEYHQTFKEVLGQ